MPRTLSRSGRLLVALSAALRAPVLSGLAAAPGTAAAAGTAPPSSVTVLRITGR